MGSLGSLTEVVVAGLLVVLLAYAGEGLREMVLGGGGAMGALVAEGGGARALGSGGFWGGGESSESLRFIISGRLTLPGVGVGVVLRECHLVALGAGVS